MTPTLAGMGFEAEVLAVPTFNPRTRVTQIPPLARRSDRPLLSAAKGLESDERGDDD